MTLTGTLTNYPTIQLALNFTVTINACVLTYASVASTAFSFTEVVKIFDYGLLLPIATYTQTPSCGYPSSY